MIFNDCFYCFTLAFLFFLFFFKVANALILGHISVIRVLQIERGRLKRCQRMILISLEPRLSHITSAPIGNQIRDYPQRINHNVTADERLGCLPPPDC